MMMSCKQWVRIFFLVVIGFWPTLPALAQEPPHTAQPPASEAREPETGTDEKPVTTPEVEVKEMREEGYRVKEATTATKTDTPLIETPQSISVITRDQMEAQKANSLAEVLRYTPGIQGETFGFEPRTTFLRIRGFDATTTGLYRDGLKLSNPRVRHRLQPGTLWRGAHRGAAWSGFGPLRTGQSGRPGQLYL